MSGNDGHGIHISGPGSTNTVVSGNYVGTDSTGELDVANEREGLRVETGPAHVGGVAEVGSVRNVISGNGGFGVLVHGRHGSRGAGQLRRQSDADGAERRSGTIGTGSASTAARTT